MPKKEPVTNNKTKSSMKGNKKKETPNISLVKNRETGPKLKGKAEKKKKLTNEFYEKELFRLQVEMVKLQEWVKEKGLRSWSSLRAAMPPAREGSLNVLPSI